MSRINTAWLRSRHATDLEVYVAPSIGKTSPLYVVTASQAGVAQDSPVLFTPNVMWDFIDGSPLGLSREEHWTQISTNFVGGAITLTVTLPGASVAGATIHPYRKGITPSINTGAHTITFDVSTWGQYFVEIPSMNNVAGVLDSGFPLQIFVSPIHINVPAPSLGGTVVSFPPGGPYTFPGGTTAIVFEPGGVHNLDPNLVANGNVPTFYVVPYGVQVYIHGGAWVNGLIRGAGGSGLLWIRGHGTLSGENYTAVADQQPAQYFMLDINPNTNGTFKCEGFTVVDSPSRTEPSTEPNKTVYDVKVMTITGDAWRVTNGSAFDLLYVKVNDDGLKLYHSNSLVTNITAWQRKVGQLFACSWGLTADVNAPHVRTVDVIHFDRPHLSPGQIGTNNYPADQAISNFVIGSANLATASLTDYLFEDFYFDEKPWQIFGFSLAWPSLPGFNDGKGDLDGFTFKDFVGPAPQVDSRFNGNGINLGTITNFHFQNVVIGGVALSAADIGGRLKFSNNDGSATFTFA